MRRCDEQVREADALGRRLAHIDMSKEASLVDAILGAPVAAIAARIAAPKEDKLEATVGGLLLGSLMGFAAGQKAAARALVQLQSGKPLQEETASMHPLLVSALTGAAVGGVFQAKKLVSAHSIGRLLQPPPKEL